VHAPAYPAQKKNRPTQDKLETLHSGCHDQPMMSRQEYDPTRDQRERTPSRRFRFGPCGRIWSSISGTGGSPRKRSTIQTIEAARAPIQAPATKPGSGEDGRTCSEALKARDRAAYTAYQRSRPARQQPKFVHGSCSAPTLPDHSHSRIVSHRERLEGTSREQSKKESTRAAGASITRPCERSR
jgi:hypothetical protein